MAYQIIAEKCSKCSNCYQVCMNGAIVDLNEYFQINPAWFTECGACTGMCYDDAILYNGIENLKPMTISRMKFWSILQYQKFSAPMYD